MPCEVVQREIGGHQCSLTQMPASKALELETRLMPLIVHAIVPLVSFLRDRESDAATQAEMVSKAITAMSQTMPPAEMAQLIRELCTNELLFIDGERVNFEKVFSGGQGVMLRYQVAAFVLEANYGPFIDALLAEGAFGLMKKQAQGTTESTGGSGGHASPTPLSAA